MHSNKQQAVKIQASSSRLSRFKLQAAGSALAPCPLSLAALLFACRFIFCLLACPLLLAAVSAAHAAETIYVVNDYRYVPASSADDPEIGHSLCGTRCNALATHFSNIWEPGGWSLVRTSSNKEITVELKSPFLGGQCICLADEYSVKTANPGGPREQRSLVREKSDGR